MDKKIIIFGNSGAGKSTLANSLGNKLGIFVYHLDLLFLDNRGRKLSLDKRVCLQNEILVKSQRCIEGNYTDCIEERIASASHIIILKIPVMLCIYNVLKRYCKGLLNKKVVGVHKKFRKTITYKFLFHWIPNYNKNIFPKILKSIEEKDSMHKVHILESYSEIEELLVNKF